jgi:phage tail sheath gpL-like
VCLQPGEHVPAGLTVTVTAMASGATDTALTAAVTAMGEDQYTTVVVGNSATTEVARVVTEMESRWQAMRAIEGSLFVGRQDTRANLTTYGNTFNSGMLVVAETEKSALAPLPWELAAQSAAISALQDQSNPARGSQGASYSGLSSAARGSRFTRAERDILLSDGVATTKSGSDGRLLVERFVTTYQTNALSLPDTSLQDHSTVRLLAAMRFTWRARVSSKFPNWLLADDGNEVPGQQIVTPKTMRAEAIAWYGDMCDAGWATNKEQFAAEVLVQRNPSDPNRIDMILPPTLMRNLLVTAAQIAYA